MQPHIRAGVLSNFMPTVRALQGDVDLVLADAGVSRELISRADNYIPYPAYMSLLSAATEHCNCSNFALEMSRRLGAENLGLVGFVMCQTKTVAEAWRSLSRFYHVHDTFGRVGFTEAEDLAYVRYEISVKGQSGVSEVLDVAAGMTANINMMLIGEDYRAERILFPYSQPDDLEPYRNLRARELLFDQPGYTTVIKADLLERPVAQHDPRMLGILEEFMESLELSHEHACSRQVEELIRTFLPTGSCTIETVARFMSVSVRTLQNRLDAEHTSFKLLLEQERRSLAVHHLSRGDLQLTQLALLLGYSELSAFSRSFRRWYGCSPRAWQQRTLKAGPP